MNDDKITILQEPVDQDDPFAVADATGEQPIPEGSWEWFDAASDEILEDMRVDELVVGRVIKAVRQATPILSEQLEDSARAEAVSTVAQLRVELTARTKVANDELVQLAEFLEHTKSQLAEALEQLVHTKSQLAEAWGTVLVPPRRGVFEELQPRQFETVFRGALFENKSTIARSMSVSYKTVANNQRQSWKKLGFTSSEELFRAVYEEYSLEVSEIISARSPG